MQCNGMVVPILRSSQVALTFEQVVVGKKVVLTNQSSLGWFYVFVHFMFFCFVN